MAAFIIWCLTACIFLGIGISCLFAKKAVGFWANVKAPEIKYISFPLLAKMIYVKL